jgi:hypothetical protein
MRSFVLDAGNGPVPALAKVKDELLGVDVVGDGHGDIDVTRKANLGSDRHGQSSHERKTTAALRELTGDGR